MTFPPPVLECRHSRHPGTFRKSHPATFLVVEAPERTPRTPEAVCNFHAGVARRTYNATHGYVVVVPVEERPATVKALLREQQDAADRLRQQREARDAEMARLHADKRSRAWATLPVGVVPILDIDDESWSGHSTVSIRLAPTEDVRWDTIRLGIEAEPGMPSFVRLSGGSPASLTPNEARVLADLLPVVAGWVDDLNALPEPEREEDA